jgi:epoxyqueuosine reductase
MDSQQKTKAEITILADLVHGLEVNAMGVASIAAWQGSRLEETAQKLLPQAHSVVMLAMEIYPEVLDLVSPGRITGAASTNDLLNTHTDYLSGRLNKATYDIAKALRSASWRTLPLPSAGCPMDTRFLEAVFSYKHAGQAAGLGTIGWHSLLITPEFGPRVRLAGCLTEAELESYRPVDFTVDCESCGLCIENCPARALSIPTRGEAYAINKFACSSFRGASGGCSECMRVCPMGR